MFEPGDDDACDYKEYVRPPDKNKKDIGVQLVLSLIIGVAALITFCVRLGSPPISVDEAYHDTDAASEMAVPVRCA